MKHGAAEPRGIAVVASTLSWRRSLKWPVFQQTYYAAQRADTEPPEKFPVVEMRLLHARLDWLGALSYLLLAVSPFAFALGWAYNKSYLSSALALLCLGLGATLLRQHRTLFLPGSPLELTPAPEQRFSYKTKHPAAEGSDDQKLEALAQQMRQAGRDGPPIDLTGILKTARTFESKAKAVRYLSILLPLDLETADAINVLGTILATIATISSEARKTKLLENLIRDSYQHREAFYTLVPYVLSTTDDISDKGRRREVLTALAHSVLREGALSSAVGDLLTIAQEVEEEGSPWRQSVLEDLLEAIARNVPADVDIETIKQVVSILDTLEDVWRRGSLFVILVKRVEEKDVLDYLAPRTLESILQIPDPFVKAGLLFDLAFSSGKGHNKETFNRAVSSARSIKEPHIRTILAARLRQEYGYEAEWADSSLPDSDAQGLKGEGEVDPNDIREGMDVFALNGEEIGSVSEVYREPRKGTNVTARQATAVATGADMSERYFRVQRWGGDLYVPVSAVRQIDVADNRLTLHTTRDEAERFFDEEPY